MSLISPPAHPADRLQPLAQLSPQQCREVRLIASDMDGTLTQNEQFQPELLGALGRLRDAGLPLVIVTGRSAGWVQAVAQYLPVAGAIAENGGLFYQPPDYNLELLVNLPDLHEHRRRLAHTFAQLQSDFPDLKESTDNRFRVTDWTFEVAGLSQAALAEIQQRCAAAGWGFTYSTVQCHIRPLEQDKGAAVQQLLARLFPQVEFATHRERVLTLGDSPNDASLFNPQDFPISVGVANVKRYAHALPHCPRYVTQAREGAGFCELVEQLLSAPLSPHPPITLGYDREQDS